MVLCCHFPYHFSGFHTLVLLMGNYYHLSPVCVCCCSSALQQHLMAAIHLVAESSYSRQVAGAGRTQNKTSSSAQNWFPSSPHWWWWWLQSQHRRPYLPGSVFIKELWSPDSDSQFSIKHLPHNKSLRLNCARQNDSRMLRHLINIIQATQLPCSSCF